MNRFFFVISCISLLLLSSCNDPDDNSLSGSGDIIRSRPVVTGILWVLENGQVAGRIGIPNDNPGEQPPYYYTHKNNDEDKQEEINSSFLYIGGAYPNPCNLRSGNQISFTLGSKANIAIKLVPAEPTYNLQKLIQVYGGSSIYSNSYFNNSFLVYNGFAEPGIHIFSINPQKMNIPAGFYRVYVQASDDQGMSKLCWVNIFIND